MRTALTRLGGSFFSARVATTSLVMVAAIGLPARAQPRDSLLDQFAAFFRSRAEAHGIVGASLRVVGPGGNLRHQSFGFQDIEAKTPTAESTIYHWASITKTITGIAIMQLRDHGRLSLDDSILKYVPELEAVHNPFGPMSAITIRHLLSHTAGFRAGTWPFGGDKPWQPHEPTEWSQLVAMMPYTEVEFAPGSKYSYSNPGVVYLGRVIEKVAGEPWEQYVQKNILMPLEMTRTFFDHAPYHLLSDRAHSYTVSKGKREEMRFDFDTGVTVSNGGLNAPLGDMEKYVRFLLGAAETRDGRGVLSRSSLEEMWTPAALVEAPGSDRVDIGLCFFLEKRRGRSLIGHSGGQNGFISHLYIDRAANAGYLVSFNTDAVDEVAVPNTRKLDAEISEFFVASVAPALEAAARPLPAPPKR